MPEPTQIQKRRFLELSSKLVKQPNDIHMAELVILIQYLDNFIKDATEEGYEVVAQPIDKKLNKD